MRFLRSGLFRRYAVTFSSLLLVSFFILGAAFLVTIAEFWTDEKLAQLSENAARVAERTEQTFRRYTDEERYAPVVMFMLSETASTLNTGLDEGAAPDQYIRMDIFVVNEEGQVVYCNDMYDRYLAGEPLACPLHQTATIPAELIQSAMHGAISGEDNLGGMFAQHRYFAAVPLKSGDGTTATGAVFATAPITEGLRPYIQQVVIRFIGATVLSILLVFVIIAYLSYRLTKPLLDMEQAASRYAVGDFSLRVYYRRKPKKPLKEKHKKRKHRHPDELIALVESFNNMAQDLSVLESTRRSFVANVSHELKTPMTTIGGFIDGILDGTIPPARQEHYLGIVSGEVKRLSRLVTGMLNMSRIEAGELHMKPKAFDLSELMLQTLLNFERLIDQKGVQVEGIDALGHVMISADRDMLSQVLYNLCDNAVKFVDGGGTIAVRVWEEEERIYATVRNSGTGIGQKDLSNVFERFYKVDQSRSYDTKSAGLGLYIVKTIIDLHGGKISAQSVESQYAEFKFWLPK
ncbi:MAG: HAMP domain-containing histidine kinase [Oscillospiraceae bacterium]|nr:HAMP domain-containing histidine kinase [Oscillospiraceae bacterium]